MSKKTKAEKRYAKEKRQFQKRQKQVKKLERLRHERKKAERVAYLESEIAKEKARIRTAKGKRKELSAQKRANTRKFLRKLFVETKVTAKRIGKELEKTTGTYKRKHRKRR